MHERNSSCTLEGQHRGHMGIACLFEREAFQVLSVSKLNCIFGICNITLESALQLPSLNCKTKSTVA